MRVERISNERFRADGLILSFTITRTRGCISLSLWTHIFRFFEEPRQFQRRTTIRWFNESDRLLKKDFLKGEYTVAAGPVQIYCNNLVIASHTSLRRSIFEPFCRTWFAWVGGYHLFWFLDIVQVFFTRKDWTCGATASFGTNSFWDGADEKLKSRWTCRPSFETGREGMMINDE